MSVTNENVATIVKWKKVIVVGSFRVPASIGMKNINDRPKKKHYWKLMQQVCFNHITSTIFDCPFRRNKNCKETP